jgi:hypothetical protein
MSPLLRGGLALAGLAGAFAAGYFLKPKLTTADAGQPTSVAATPAAGKPVSSWAPGDALPAIAAQPTASIQVPEVPEVRLPDVPPVPAITDKIDPSDPAFQMIKKELGIKTTILDKSEPPPLVLTQAQKTPEPPVVILPPIPMEGPVPRLEPPPPAAVPEIPNSHVGLTPPLTSRLINTRDVALDFEVTKTGTSKVTAVELWTTRDGGKTWAKTDRMTGAKSPFRTRLGSEGEYGFRLVFESESGMRTREPGQGEGPELRVILDTTPPTISNLTIGPAEASGNKVRVQWEMVDAHLDHAGVRIEYSADGQDWRPAVLDQAGAHNPRGADFRIWTAVWMVPQGLPHRVMIRVFARDRAGNESMAELPQQVSIDLVAPAGKLTGVRTTGADPESGPMPREVQGRAAVPELLRPVLPVLLGSPSVAQAGQ